MTFGFTVANLSRALLAVFLGVGVIGIFWALPPGGAKPISRAPVVRLAVVFTPEESGLLAELLPEFERQTGYQVEVDSREDVYDVARNGKADLVISHYGHPGVEPFVTEGLGLWPRTVFANQAALLGPSGDPAHVGGLNDAVEAFRRIAHQRARFLVNNSAAEKYLAEILWEGAGRPDKGNWYIDRGLQQQQAVEAAAELGAYTLWGLVPFLRLRERSELDMEALLLSDPLLQRIMVSVVVNPEKIPGSHVKGALALQRYMIAPATQARIRSFRYPGLNHQMWWPSGRNNAGAFLTGR
jgi:tungstate transport system substrate-binding protein